MVACETNDSDPAGCGSGEQCLPDLASPLEAWCIHRTGTHACPSGPYSERTIYYEDFDDNRSCSACACGPASGSCEGTVDFRYGGTGCGTTRFQLADHGAPSGIKASPGPITLEGECVPSGSTLQGSIDRASAVTVCCVP